MGVGSLVLFAAMTTAELYAAPRTVSDAADCHFYHVMEIPGYGLTTGQWDLRGNEQDYLGHVSVAGKRVLEIGPASGYLSFYMESQGAAVVSVELSPEQKWDAVPEATLNVEEFSRNRVDGMEKLRNSYWYAHERLQSKAQVHYGSAYSLPSELGRFDVATLCSVLLHVRDPLKIVQNCAAIADTLIISDLRFEDVPDDVPTMKWFSTRESPSLDTWWRFSPQLFVRFGEVMGFTSTAVTFHEQTWTMDEAPRGAALYTVVLSGRSSS
jgi:2-polyprenyl-3-methyl-5-hydroxy-6-metoxy-1,4-benzoquinol methylase